MKSKVVGGMLCVALTGAVPAQAQDPQVSAPAPRPVDRSELRHQVYVDRNPNAALLLGANHLALAIIVVTAILTSSDGFAQGLVDSAVYGLVGIVLQAVALVIMNRALPGRLVSLVGEPHMSGAAWAVAVTLVCVSAVACGPSSFSTRNRSPRRGPSVAGHGWCCSPRWRRARRAVWCTSWRCSPCR